MSTALKNKTIGFGGGKSIGFGGKKVGFGGSFKAFKKREPSPTDEAFDGEKLEQYSERVLTEAQKKFKESAQNEAKRFQDATDSEFWFAVCFQTRAQKDAFLESTGLVADGDKYIDAAAVAKLLGVSLIDVSIKYNSNVKLNQKLADLATDITQKKPKVKLRLKKG